MDTSDEVNAKTKTRSEANFQGKQIRATISHSNIATGKTSNNIPPRLFGTAIWQPIANELPVNQW